MTRNISDFVGIVRRIGTASCLAAIVAIGSVSSSGPFSAATACGCDGKNAASVAAAPFLKQDDLAERKPPVLQLRLVATADGRLEELIFREISLGNDDQAFVRLTDEILEVAAPGTPEMKELTVEIDADRELRHEYVIRAVSAVTGKFGPTTGEVVRHVEMIKFAPPRKRTAH